MNQPSRSARIRNTLRDLLWPLFAGMLTGLAFSAIPLLLNLIFLAIPFGFILWSKRGFVQRLVRFGLAMVVLILTTAICAQIPTKALDWKVRPFAFKQTPLWEVHYYLRTKYELPSSLYVSPGVRERLIDFEVPGRMTKREVLNKFAAEQGLFFEEGYCATGATILWGAHPSFCQIREKRETDAGPEDLNPNPAS